MRAFFGLTLLVVALLAALAVLREGDGDYSHLQVTVSEVRVINALRTEPSSDPKSPAPVPVNILSNGTAVVFARTKGIDHLDVTVALSGTESFGTYTGWPDRNSFVKIEVPIPAAGSEHAFRVPGPEGQRIAGGVRPGTLFILQTSGIVAEGIRISGDPIWVRIDE